MDFLFMSNYLEKNPLGSKRHMLTLMEFTDVRKNKENRNIPYANFKCDCGNITNISIRSFGKTKSCGCAVSLRVFSKIKTHGYASKKDKETRLLYNTWWDMKNRCYNPKNKHYNDYGGRGIIVCERWLNSIKNFVDDMGYKPSRKHSIDRIKVNENYDPNNCRWATTKEQGNNKTNSVMIEYLGKNLNLTQWIEELNIKGDRSWLYKRVKQGWSMEKIHNWYSK